MAVENVAWDGATGVWALSTNWKQLNGTAAGHYPGEDAEADVCFMDGRSSLNITGWVYGSILGNPIGGLTVSEDFRGSLGTQDLPLTFDDADNGTLTYSGQGSEAWLLGVFATVNVLATGSGDDALHLSTETAYTLMNILSGKVTLDSQLNGQTNPSAGVVTLTIGNGPNVLDPVVTIAAPVTTVLNLYQGTVYWNSGTITQLNQYGGNFLCSRSVTSRTLTNASIYGGNCDLRTGYAGASGGSTRTIVLTNPIKQYGGEPIKTDPGMTLQTATI